MIRFKYGLYHILGKSKTLKKHTHKKKKKQKKKQQQQNTICLKLKTHISWENWCKIHQNQLKIKKIMGI